MASGIFRGAVGIGGADTPSHFFQNVTAELLTMLTILTITRSNAPETA
jgi:hypothetical protein